MFETAKTFAAEILPNWFAARRKAVPRKDGLDFRTAAMTKPDLIVRRPTSPYRPANTPDDRASNM